MALPCDLILVRHGESEGNVALRESRNGNDFWYEKPEFFGRHSSQWRLTDKGIEQSRSAGVWLRENFAAGFDRHYVSEYLRAKETAAHLGLLGAQWYSELYLREREWGDMDVISESERKLKFFEQLRRRELDGSYWRPPNGESLAELCIRIDRILDTLHRECAGKRVVIVCHGEVMWAFRLRLERMSQARFRELDMSKDQHHHIHNCQVLHYTRRSPQSGTVGSYLSHMRSVCPWDTSLSSNEWEKIERASCSNADLLAELEGWPRIVNDSL